MVRRDSKVVNFAKSLFFFLLIIIRSGLLAGIRWSVCMLKSHRKLCESFSRTGAGLCIYHLFVWSNWNSCTFPSESPCRPSCVLLYTPSGLICCIRLLCDWSFRLCHRIAYIYCFVASYLFSLVAPHQFFNVLRFNHISYNVIMKVIAWPGTSDNWIKSKKLFFCLFVGFMAYQP